MLAGTAERRSERGRTAHAQRPPAAARRTCHRGHRRERRLRRWPLVVQEAKLRHRRRLSRRRGGRTHRTRCLWGLARRRPSYAAPTGAASPATRAPIWMRTVHTVCTSIRPGSSHRTVRPPSRSAGPTRGPQRDRRHSTRRTRRLRRHRRARQALRGGICHRRSHSARAHALRP
jgi:hypothetical protein